MNIWYLMTILLRTTYEKAPQASQAHPQTHWQDARPVSKVSWSVYICAVRYVQLVWLCAVPPVLALQLALVSISDLSSLQGDRVSQIGEQIYEKIHSPG